MSPTVTPRKLRGIDEAADYLGVTPRTVRRYIAEGRLTGYRIGNKLIRVDMADVAALVVAVIPGEVSR